MEVPRSYDLCIDVCETDSGSPKPITATSHKLTKLIYRMLKYGEDYVDKGQEYYEQPYQECILKNLNNEVKQLRLQLLNPNTGEIVYWI